METVSQYILEEKNLVSKMEIIYYLSKKTKIFFEKSVIFKTEIVRQFIEYMKLDIDINLVLTASLLCNCKKVDDAQTIGKLHTYAKEGAEYLEELGFDKRFCKICEEINRYSGSSPRERESDILEVVDQFGGMLLNRPERIGMQAEEAIVLLEHRNLKDIHNKYLNTFIEYVNEMEKIEIHSQTTTTALKKLVKIFNETPTTPEFIRKLIYQYIPEVDQRVAEYRQKTTSELLGENQIDPTRALFSAETTKKILNQINKQEANT